jgi:hypothetical protein
VTLELTHHGEAAVEEGTFAESIRAELGVDEDWPVFVPVRAFEKRGRRVTVHLMEGYAFIATGLDEIRYFRLEQTKLVNHVLASRGSRGMRVLAVISDATVAELRRQLNEEVASDIVPGMEVLVTDGTYCKLRGIVTDTEGDHAVVRFELRSLRILSKIPKVFLDTA